MAVGRIVLSAYMPARDRNGRLVNGARLYVYENRTTTKTTLFADSYLSIPLANPVIANSSGQFPDIWVPRGTVEEPMLYTLSVTGKDGQSIGNPSVFDDFMPSSDEVAADSAVVAIEARNEAVEAAEDAADSAAVAAQQASAANTARSAAEAAADEAAITSITGESIYPTATSYVPVGLIVGPLDIDTHGSGYTNGTFALQFSGGNYDVNPTGTFTVVGGFVSEATITGSGRCINASPSMPTPSFAASSGGTGAVVTLAQAPLVEAGHYYWADHASDTTLYQLYENNSGSPAAVSGATIVKSLALVNQRYERVKLEFIPGSGTASSTYSLKPAQSWVQLVGFGYLYIFEWLAPFPCNGAHNVRIYQADGVTLFLDLTAVWAPDGSQAALNSFQKWDLIEAFRDDPAADNPPTQFGDQLIQITRPNTVTTTVTSGLQRLVAQRPSPDFRVSVQQLDKTNYMIRTCSLIGPADRVMDDDHVVWVMKDLAESMSLEGNVCASALALNTDWAIHNGQEFRYSQFLSDEAPGGDWTREQPSTTEPVDRVGVYGDNVSTYNTKGLNHAGFMANTLADRAVEMDGEAISLTVMAMFNGGELEIVQRYDDYRNDTEVNGESWFTHTFNQDGCTISRHIAVGRQLSFDAGLVEITPGLTIEGGTSGAVSEVVSIPASQQTGSWGTNRAGKLFVKHISGTWADNEQIIDPGTGDPYATVNGILGPQVGAQNCYGVLSCNTSINRIWAGFEDGLTLFYDSGSVAFGVGEVVVGEDSGVSAVVATVPTTGQTGSVGAGTLAGYLTFSSTTPNGDNSVWWPGERLLVAGVPKARVKAAITLGAANNDQITVAPTGYPIPDMYRAWHTNNDVFRQLVIPSGAPSTPPGDYSLCTTSIAFIEDRIGGNRKIVVNWCSAEGTSAVLYEGEYDTSYTINYGVAWPGVVS